MAWRSITVELIGRPGAELWPHPGRVLGLRDDHSFAQLSAAINTAFGRWEPATGALFHLPDGRMVGDAEWDGAPADLVDHQLAVAELVEGGTEFRYLVGSTIWVHACRVDKQSFVPSSDAGLVPDVPFPLSGWGDVPDPYDRRWPEGEGESELADGPHPMLAPSWPAASRPRANLRDLRGASYATDPDRLFEAVNGLDVSELLQHASATVMAGLLIDRDRFSDLAGSLVSPLRRRGLDGDEELADDLTKLSHGGDLPGKSLKVSLDELANQLEGGDSYGEGFLNIQTGEVLSAGALDWGLDDEVDVDDGNWESIDQLGSRVGWKDMARFVDTVTDPRLKGLLENAIQGRGAFRRFRDVIHAEGLAATWNAYSDERRLGRARAWLATIGIRPMPGHPEF